MSIAACGGGSLPLVPGVDGAIGLSAPNAFYYGHPGTPFKVQVSNLGDTAGAPPVQVKVQMSLGVTLAGSGPSGWSCSSSGPLYVCEWNASLPAGSSIADLELSLAFGSMEEVKDTVRICVELRVKEDVNPNNNQLCESFPIFAPTADYDLEISKELWSVGSGGPNNLTYLVKVKNLGPDSVHDPIFMEDLLPLGLTINNWGTSLNTSCSSDTPTSIACSAGYLGTASHNNTMIISVGTTMAPGLAGELTNCATVQAPLDFNLTNNEACHTFNVGAPEPFDLQIIGEVWRVPEPGITGVYRFTITNLGANPTTETLHILMDAPPPSSTLSYVSGIDGSVVPATNIGQCTPVGTQLSCPVSPVFAPGESRIFWMSFFMNPVSIGLAPACWSFNADGDTDPSNNEACLSLPAAGPTADFGVTAKLGATNEAVKGSLGGLQFFVTSSDGEDVPEPVLAFVVLPPAVSYVGMARHQSFECSADTPEAAGQLVTCIHDGPMAAGTEESLTLAVFYELDGQATVCGEVAPSVEGISPQQTQSCAALSIQPAE